MKFEPLPQQQIMFDFLLKHPVAACFVEMGLSKTATILWLLSHLLPLGEARGALVVAPLRVCNLTWPAEMEQWDEFGWMRMTSLRTEEGLRAWDRGAADIYLINYEMLPKFVDRCLVKKDTPPVDIVVWDELSKAKDPSGKRIKAFMKHRSKFVRHIGLTGTPASNSYADVFAQIRLLDGGAAFGTSWTAFRDRYFEGDYMGWKFTLRDWAAKAIEEKLKPISLVLRQKDWLNLPPTSVEDIDLELPDKLYRQYRELEKELLLTIRDREIVAPNAAALTGKLLQFTCGLLYDSEREVVPVHDIKLTALASLSKKLNEPILVAASFIHERERIVREVPGAEAFDERQMERWSKGKIKLWVGDVRSISHGLNLQHGGHHVVWMTPTWSRDNYDQTNARLIRKGQTKSVTVHRLMMRDTIDWAVAAVLEQKGQQQDELLNALKNLKRMRKP